jgi:phasin protein
VTQTEKHPNPIFPNLMSPEMAGIGRKNLETLAAVQKEFLDALSKANRVWVAYFNEEAALTSNFTEKLTKTKSIPDAAVAYQEWMSQHMQLLSKQAQKVLAETQDFTKACTQIVDNGRGLGSS